MQIEDKEAKKKAKEAKEKAELGPGKLLTKRGPGRPPKKGRAKRLRKEFLKK